jgi:hypothetical protein
MVDDTYICRVQGEGLNVRLAGLQKFKIGKFFVGTTFLSTIHPDDQSMNAALEWIRDSIYKRCTGNRRTEF